jgi:hypothetical protein
LFANRLVDYLVKRAGFVVMKRPHEIGGAAKRLVSIAK